MERVLVTGAGGFIGHHLVTRLKELDYWVRGVDLKYPEYRPTDADEFVLSVLKPRTGFPFTSKRNRAVEILICTEGAAEITDPDMNDVFPLDRGASIMVPASLGQYKIRGEATIYKATVPMA